MIRKAVALCAALAVTGCSVASMPSTTGAIGDPAQVELVHVIDGDTIIVDDGGEEQKVRFLGIDTPEISHGDEAGEPCGEEARDMTEELTAAGEVELRADDAQPAEDRYGRRLAYVEVDGTDLSAELLSAGLADIYHSAPDIARFGDYEKLVTEATQPACADVK